MYLFRSSVSFRGINYETANAKIAITGLLTSLTGDSSLGGSIITPSPQPGKRFTAATKPILRLALIIDLAMEIGYFPNDRDFPATLQWLNRSTIRFPMYRIMMSYMGFSNESNIETEKRICEDRNTGILSDRRNRGCATNLESRYTSPTAMSPSTNGFIDQKLLITA
jgi:hypothetical protein